MEQIQSLHRIGACENAQAQPDWTGPAIQPCSAPPAFLCEICGHLLCGGHAGGHSHPSSDAGALASRFQSEAAAAQAQTENLTKAKAEVEAALTKAQQDCARVAAIRKIVEVSDATAGTTSGQ